VLVPAANVQPGDTFRGGRHMGRLALYRRHVSDMRGDEAHKKAPELSR
jgi:hypothetical protein